MPRGLGDDDDDVGEVDVAVVGCNEGEGGLFADDELYAGCLRARISEF